MRQVQETTVTNDTDLDVSGLETMQAVIPVRTEQTRADENITIVDRDYLPMVKGDQLREWVRTKYNMRDVSDEILTTQIMMLQKEKTEVRKIARDYIHYFFVEALKNK